MGKVIDMVGKIYGRLEVVKRAENDEHNQARWVCECECGNETTVRGADLRSGKILSCNCYRKEQSKKSVYKHGFSKSSVYSIWLSMIQRCTNPNNKDYHHYGGRGITVCDQWLNDFNQFYKDMGDRPSEKHTLDRTDNSKGYNPSNCKWITWNEQARNKRTQKNNTTGVNGVSWHKGNSGYIARINADGERLHLGYFNNLEDAANARKKAEKEYWNA